MKCALSVSLVSQSRILINFAHQLFNWCTSNITQRLNMSNTFMLNTDVLTRMVCKSCTDKTFPIYPYAANLSIFTVCLSQQRILIHFIALIYFILQLKGSDLALTIVKGSSLLKAPPNGPACSYVNLRVKVNNKEQGTIRQNG